MILTIKKKHNLPLIVDTDKMTGFKESGSGYDITFGDETYYFSLKDTIYMINQLFPNEPIAIKKSTSSKKTGTSMINNLYYKLLDKIFNSRMYQVLLRDYKNYIKEIR